MSIQHLFSINPFSKLNWLLKIIFFAFILFSLSSCVSDHMGIFVSTKGDDNTGDGTINKPFLTLERARDRIRELKENEKVDKRIWVYLRGGTYNRKRSFSLTERDSGEDGFPIIYSSYKDEKVIIHGGLIIPVEKKRKKIVSDVYSRLNKNIRDKIWEIDLASAGITNYGKMRPVGFARPFGPLWAELFVNGKPYHIARWPNDSTIKMGRIIDKGAVPRDDDFSNRGGAFEFETERPKIWQSHDDILISGYFGQGWAEDAVELMEIDTVNNIFKTKQPSLYGFASGKKFSRWYVYNILEEIDEPGEYYLDRKNGKLYFYPMENVHSIELSMLEKPLVSIKRASNIQFRGLTFECSRGIGVYMEHTNNNLIVNCTFKNLGIVGVCMGKGIEPFKDLCHENLGKPASELIGSYLQHTYSDPVFNRDAGHSNGVINCEIYDTGAEGIHLSGGDRLTLEPGNNYVENCKIHDFNRIEKSYRAGIDISGVGNRISHCELYNAPSMAILLHGNNHLIEYNEIHHVCRDVHDQGALYYGRDPSERGHLVRYNFFHHLNSIHTTSAVYHDDGACGMEVFGNVFYKPGEVPALIGGGMDNPYTNNIFIDAELGISVDNRNQNWSNDELKEGGIYAKRLNLVNYKNPPYSTEYPNLAKYWEDEPSLPKRNTVSKNIFFNVTTPVRYNKDWLPFKDDNWVTKEDPGVVDYENMNFKLKENAKAFSQVDGFQDIPFEKIGVINV